MCTHFIVCSQLIVIRHPVGIGDVQLKIVQLFECTLEDFTLAGVHHLAVRYEPHLLTVFVHPIQLIQLRAESEEDPIGDFGNLNIFEIYLCPLVSRTLSLRALRSTGFGMPWSTYNLLAGQGRTNSAICKKKYF